MGASKKDRQMLTEKRNLRNARDIEIALRYAELSIEGYMSMPAMEKISKEMGVSNATIYNSRFKMRYIIDKAVEEFPERDYAQRLSAVRAKEETALATI